MEVYFLFMDVFACHLVVAKNLSRGADERHFQLFGRSFKNRDGRAFGLASATDDDREIMLSGRVWRMDLELVGVTMDRHVYACTVHDRQPLFP